MRLAILHHHLNRGGVSQVIANHLRSLATLPAVDRPERVAILFDGQRDGWPDDPLHGSGAFPVELISVPALAYDQPGAKADPEALAAAVTTGLAAHGYTADGALLHTHNHALGKNASLPGALRILAEDGWRMLLQVHDFAEDNRPENYRHLREAIGESDPDRLGAILYPQGAGIHYATLTERDAEILRTAGVPTERLHPLPNPVAEFDGMPSQEEARGRVFPLLGLAPEARLIVYPVRGIRRKNLGEMLLLSALAPEGTYFAVTLRPKNPVEAASFDRWRRIAEECDLPCRFDTGGSKEEGGYGCDFKDTLAAADAILTTSVAEGFGMVFLEAWLAGKPLVGRDLPEITREFKAAGMTFGGLYDELRIPLASFRDADEAKRDSVGAYFTACARYGVESRSESDVQHDLDGMTADGCADYARLATADQATLFYNLRQDASLVESIQSANPWLKGRLERDPHLEGEVAANAAAVREHYSLTRLAERLAEITQSTRAYSNRSDDFSPVSGDGILHRFLDLESVHHVRIEGIGAPGCDDSALRNQIKALSNQLDPQPTNETPVVTRLPGLRAVVFDVYGTLLVSGSGDISLASEGARGSAASEALQAVLGEPATQVAGVNRALDETPATSVAGSPVGGDAIVAALHDAIRAAHAASSSEHPEVEIRDIWRTVLGKMEIAANDVQIDRLAVEYECRVNPIWPMPGLVETLDALSEAELEFGIVSNAQFFTPLAFEPLAGKPLDWWGFEPDLCVWSYEHGEAKPGTFLYERCAEGLAARGVSPDEALFVGNDLRNDVWPAQKVGFRTALFAGDARSLRWRRDDARLNDVRPDAVVTDLRQLLEIVL